MVSRNEELPPIRYPQAVRSLRLPICSKCTVVLTSANWGQYQRLHHEHICQDCKRKMRRSYNSSHARQIAATPSQQAARVRERSWKRQGIEFHGAPLTYETYLAVRKLQDERCPILGTLFTMGIRGLEHADHDHLTREFRGVLSGGRKGANFRLVGRYENGQRHTLNPAAIAAVEAYLYDPPAAQYARTLKGA